MVTIPAPNNEDETKNDDQPMEITEGTFERTVVLDRQQAGDFLVHLGEQLQVGTDLTLTTEEWELPFEFREPVEIEIEFVGFGERELEIELELTGPRDDGGDIDVV